MLSEINEIPQRAQDFLNNERLYQLPLQVPYLGMGSSYFAPLAFKYMGIDIQPELASEFYNYLQKGKKISNGVLLSQSGRSSEVLWCSTLFEQYIAITNELDSPLCRQAAVTNIIPLRAGEEKYSSSKTYINSLLALFRGFGMDMRQSVDLLAGNMENYNRKGAELADAVFTHLQQGATAGLYITGSGPNIATALEAALILSESTKLTFTGLPLAQYDHGPKETAKNSIVINIIAKGKSYGRSQKLGDTIRAAGALVLEVEAPEGSENESVLHNIVPFNFMAHYLSQHLNVQEIFAVGGKVTEVDEQPV